MANLLAVIFGTLRLLIDVLQFMMFARAIVSWIPSLSDSSAGEFLFSVTEWLIMPVRSLFDRFGWNANTIIDLPFFATFILLSFIRTLI